MKLIGAGLPRTATTTQWLALRTLGFPTYHMKDMMDDLPSGVDVWRRAFDGKQPWDEVFDGFTATVDFPAAYHWRELMDYYPDAKVLLSVRDGDAWAKSMQDTICQIYFGDSFMRAMCLARYRIDPDFRGWFDLNVDMLWQGPRAAAANTFGERQALADFNDRWNDEVKATVPADRLLVWKPQDGWEPLCEFLDVPVPSEPLPHAFDTQVFHEATAGGAVATVAEWWAKNHPPQG